MTLMVAVPLKQPLNYCLKCGAYQASDDEFCEKCKVLASNYRTSDNEGSVSFDERWLGDPDLTITGYHEGDIEDPYFHGLVLHREAKYSEAIKYYDKSIKISNDNDDDYQCSLAWYNRGLALYSLGKYNEASESFDKAINLIDPLDLRFVYALARSEVKKGRIDDGLMNLKKIKNLTEGDGWIRFLRCIEKDQVFYDIRNNKSFRNIVNIK
jgi:tetratricopeptide (TPR) repeat protein